jgi:catechol 2,3-dioxygenase-like lactoylglutathione lyase family enzyme
VSAPTEPSQPDRPADGRWIGIDHVQLAIPPGGEDAAREFYVGALGLTEVPKPAALAVRGGAWFEAGRVRIHVGREDAFVPARKAHPALLVAGLRRLVAEAALDVRWDDEIPGVERCHVSDPFGNRIELIESGPVDGGPVEGSP